jgi:hypothetical protein
MQAIALAIWLECQYDRHLKVTRFCQLVPHKRAPFLKRIRHLLSSHVANTAANITKN